MSGWEKKSDGWQILNSSYNNSHNVKSNLGRKNIFVLAGGINKDGLCHDFVKKRLDLCIQQYTNTSKVFCIGGGSYHIPTICNKQGFSIFESSSCSEYLIKNGIPSKSIYKEWGSYDTIANGFFSFTNFIIPMKLSNITVITSEFHMNRAKFIFDWMKEIFNSDCNITYLNSINNIESDILKIRIQREKNSLKNLHNVKKQQNTLSKFLCWFYTEHKAYCAIENNVRINVLDEKCKKTY